MGKQDKEYSECDDLGYIDGGKKAKSDKGFYSHMAVNKIKTNHKKAKSKYQRNF